MANCTIPSRFTLFAAIYLSIVVLMFQGLVVDALVTPSNYGLRRLPFPVGITQPNPNKIPSTITVTENTAGKYKMYSDSWSKAMKAVVKGVKKEVKDQLWDEVKERLFDLLNITTTRGSTPSIPSAPSPVGGSSRPTHIAFFRPCTDEDQWFMFPARNPDANQCTLASNYSPSSLVKPQTSLCQYRSCREFREKLQNTALPLCYVTFNGVVTDFSVKIDQMFASCV